MVVKLYIATWVNTSHQAMLLCQGDDLKLDASIRWIELVARLFRV